jgi:hypothetical protein
MESRISTAEQRPFSTLSKVLETMNRLRLMALDVEDLAVISAQVQDAVSKPEALDYRPAVKQFVAVINRFAWDAEAGGEKRADGHERRQSILSFGRVLAVRTRGIRRDDGDQVLSLLALRFEGTAAPAGTIELIFADGPIVQLDVECMEVQLEDAGAAWETRFKPRHPAS